MRKQSVLFVLALCGLLMAITYAWTHFALLNTITHWEDAETIRNKQRLENTILAEINQLSMLAEDWAYWDDTLDFITTQNADYLNKNLTTMALETINLDVLLLFDVQRNLVYSGGQSGEWPGFSDLMAMLVTESAAGFIQHNEHIFLTALRPILDSHEQGEPGGSLVMMRLVDESFLSHIADRVGVYLTIQSPTLSEGAHISNGTIIAVVPFDDLSGSPLMSISMDIPRTVYITARRTAGYLGMGQFAIGLLAIFSSLLFLDRKIITRVEGLVSALRQVQGASHVPFSQPHSPYNDELTLLGEELQKMLIRVNSSQQQLAESEGRYRTLIETAPTAILVSDLDGKVTLTNEQAAILHGYSSCAVMLGLNVACLVTPRDHEKVREAMQRLREEHSQMGLEMTLLRKDGSEFYAEVTGAPVKSSQGEIASVLYMYIDITERREADERLRYLSLHDQLTGIYNRAYFEGELTRLQKDLRYPVSIIVADFNGFKMVNDMFGHKKGDEILKTAAAVLQRTLRSSDVLARMGGDEFAIALPSTDETTAKVIVQRIYAAVTKYNLESGAVPLSLSLGASTSTNPSSLLEDTYNLADSHMYREKQRQGTGYRESMLKALRENRITPNKDSDGHVRRLEILCLNVGEALGLPAYTLQRLSLLCRAHDFGYISIPARIVEKKGPLTETEWELIREHPERGYQIALATSEFSDIAELVLYHQERWDGLGYPRGLRGEEIPLECRIFALADAFDMMTTTHGYRDAGSEADALAEIRREAGTQFDPQLAELFISLRTNS